jgi:hypothetical protein
MKKFNVEIDFDQILAEVKNIIKEGDEFSGEDFNGRDPLARTPGEATLINAVTEYCNQTGKELYKNDLVAIIVGIAQDFDSTEKIEQLKRFVKSSINSKQHVREPEGVENLEAPDESLADEPNFEDDEPEAEEGFENIDDEDMEAVEEVSEGEDEEDVLK